MKSIEERSAEVQEQREVLRRHSVESVAQTLMGYHEGDRAVAVATHGGGFILADAIESVQIDGARTHCDPANMRRVVIRTRSGDERTYAVFANEQKVEGHTFSPRTIARWTVRALFDVIA